VLGVEAFNLLRNGKTGYLASPTRCRVLSQPMVAFALGDAADALLLCIRHEPAPDQQVRTLSGVNDCACQLRLLAGSLTAS
jgi:hypothetical protein